MWDVGHSHKKSTSQNLTLTLNRELVIRQALGCSRHGILSTSSPPTDTFFTTMVKRALFCYEEKTKYSRGFSCILFWQQHDAPYQKTRLSQTAHTQQHTARCFATPNYKHDDGQLKHRTKHTTKATCHTTEKYTPGSSRQAVRVQHSQATQQHGNTARTDTKSSRYTVPTQHFQHHQIQTHT